jgi:hypothetical protein
MRGLSGSSRQFGGQCGVLSLKNFDLRLQSLDLVL